MDLCIDPQDYRPEMLQPATEGSLLQVLLVEDDDADAYLISEVLMRDPRVGVIRRARDGVEALEMIDEGRAPPHLAIIDLHMPRKNGFSLLLELSVRPISGCALAVLTSSVADADAIRSKLRGANYYLTKPVAMASLAVALSDLITDVIS
ncbi:response regulator [Brevundimonas sp.]|uniref:response regulator n=1 Tax=Brevundimonas sp. TaxID=1871086 RepID=UPI00182C53CA|nr:response regulator [Brevundimonas sp.]MBA4809055.1 response regulator [Brevundimonas sp.]